MPGGAILIPGLGVLSCFYLMLALPVIAWVRFLVWLDLGMIIYWFYGRLSSPLANKAEAGATDRRAEPGEPVTVLGTLTIFNGAAITLLAFIAGLGDHDRDHSQVA